jgi:hypothetical protein
MKAHGRRARVVAAGLFAAVVVGCPAVARADILAADEFSGGSFGLNIGLLDLSTGQALPAPAGVNTVADEFHPSLSSDSRLLVFERRSPTLGVSHVFMIDRQTGTLVQLPETSIPAPFEDAAIRADGREVFVVASANPVSTETSCPGRAYGSLTIDVTNFPAGPFPSQLVGQNACWGFLAPSLAPDGAIAYEYLDHPPPDCAGCLIQGVVRQSTKLYQRGGWTQPALRPGASRFAIVVRGGELFSAQFISNPPPAPVLLPMTVSSPDVRDSRPAWTGDGRYLGWIRSSQGALVHEVVMVFDTVTQQVVITQDLGNIGDPYTEDHGSLALAFQPTLVSVCTTCSFSSFTFTTSSSTGAGFLIQRILGHHELFGHRVPKLATVGRFPLGKFGAGRHKTRWNFTVNGHKLTPGQYYVTLRAITAKLGVRDLSKPFLVTIPKHGRPLVHPVR